jgi:K+-sensing histidine kinase KdpD
MVPIIFLVIITVLAIHCGSRTGVVGTLISAALFALYLFPPIGSFLVHDLGQRTSLGWFLVGGVTLSILIGTPPAKPSAKHKTNPQ